MPNAQALVNKLLEAGPDDDPNQYVDWLGNRQKFLDGRLKEGLDEPEQYLRGKAYTLYELRDRLEDNGLYFPNGGIFPWGRWAIIHGFAYWAVDKLEQPLPQSFFREQLEKVCKELGFTIYHIQLKGNFPNQISFKLAVPKMQVDPEAYEWQERRLNDPDFASSRRTFNKTSRGWLPEAEIPVPDPDSDLNVNPERYVRELTGLKAIDYSRREPEYGHNWLVFDVYRRKVGRIGLNHEDSTRWGWITVERPRLRLPDDVWINDYATKEELLQAAAPYVVPPRVIESTDPDDPSINIERHTDNLDIDAVMNKLGFVKRDEFNIWYKTKALKEWRVWPTTSDNVYGVTCMVRVSKKYDWVEKNSFTCHVTELEQMLREEGALKEALDPDAPEANIDDPDPYIKNFPIPVKAEIVADMNPEGRASFDATPWFDQATFEKVAALAKIGFQGNYAADDVGEFFFETTLRDWYKNYDGEGFEVYVDEADARRWLEHNHPDWYAAIWPDEVQESVDDPTPEFIHSAFDVPAMLKNRGYEKSSIGEQWSKVFRRVANGLDLMIVVNRRGFGGEKDEGDIIYDITLYRDNQKREWEPFGYKYGRNNKQLEQSLKSLEERVRKNDLQDDVDIDLDIDESVPEPPADDPDDPSMTLAAHTADLPELEPHQNPVIHKHAHGQLDELKAIGFTPSHIALKHTVFGEEEIPGFWSKNYPTFAGRVLFIHLLADDDGVMMSFRTRAIPAPGITLQPRSMAHIVTIVKELDAVMEQSAREKMPPEAETQALREIARKHSQWCRKPAYESVPEPPADPDDPQAFIQRMETDFRRILDKYGFKHGKGVYAGFYTHYYPDKVWGRPCRVTVTPGWFDFDEYVKANWPADVPTDCTYLDANEFDCFDDNVENPCASCRTYTELEKAFNNHSRADDFPDTMTVYIGNTASLGARFPASKLEAFLSRFTKAADKLVGTETKEHGLSYLLTNAAKQAASEIQEALEVPDPDDPSVNVERHTADLDVETILKRYGFEKLTPYQWERTLPTGFRIRVYPADVTNTTNQFALVRYDPNDLIRERVRFHASALKNALLTAGVPPVIEALEVPEPDPDDPSDVIRSHEHSLFPAELKRLEFEAKPKQGTANVYGNEMPRYWVKFYKAADGTTRALNLYLIGGQTTEVRANNWNFVAKSWFQHGHDWSDSPAKNEPHLCAIVRDLNDAMKRSAEDSLPPDQEHESIRRILKHHRQWWDDTLDYLINTKGGTIPGQIGPGEPA